ncbi:MAG: amidohydrolase [Acidimicrobiia bacterium]|nr:amidohydrolase [Acidimicrobiia bacterium]
MAGSNQRNLTVYPAARIITMNRSRPTATAVAVDDDRGLIVEVGTLETMTPWLDAHPHRIDDTFADKIILPGFIDPHLHPSMAAVLLPMQFITAMEWRLPWQTAAPVRGHQAYRARLADVDKEMTADTGTGAADPAEPLITWGYHQIWHGEMHREILNRISDTRPIVVWHRSFHELWMNDAALDRFELDRDRLATHPHVDIDAGRFYESGQQLAVAKLNPHLLAPDRFGLGLDRLKQAVHFGGHTTIGDMAVGIFDLDMEWQQLVAALDTDDTPFRTHLTPLAAGRRYSGRSDDEVLADLAVLPERNTHRLRFGNHVKLFTDGAFFSELMQVSAPGYIDGHHGEWMIPPEMFEDRARLMWNNGYRIHVHCTGDLGLQLALDTLDQLQFERPRFDHRFTIEHFGLSTPEQVGRIAALGACVSANVYYLHELADAYWRHSIGHERASQMGRLGSLVAAGVPTALHTDFTMAPASPLNSAWVAVNRLSESGTVMAPAERLSVEQALRAITIDAAYVLGMEDEVGSIRAGKSADFTILEADPLEVEPAALNEIPIWGTVFEGRPFPLGERR